MSESFDKVGFLKTCMEESGARIDFQKVADELNIKRGAAYMRFQRMMKPGSKTTPSAQNLEYLQTCFRVSDVKLNFVKVGEKLGIKQGAASMRYRRLMEAASKSTNGTSSTEATPSKKRGAAATEKANGSAKKRKTKAKYESESDSDSNADDELLASFEAESPKPNVKKEKEEKLKIKKEMSKAKEEGMAEDEEKREAKVNVKGEGAEDFDDFMDAREYLHAHAEGQAQDDEDEFEV